MLAGVAEARQGPVYLARHGETDDNRPPLRFQGFRDTRLNATGTHQAAALAQRVAGLGIRSLWSSDLRRAADTARIVGERLGLAPRLDPRLREANRGRWEGYLFEEVARREPQLFAEWLRAGPQWRFPGGESLLEQQQRVVACVDEIAASGERPALAVCHGGSIRVVLCLHDARGLSAFHDFEVPNTSLFELRGGAPLRTVERPPAR
jgi:broad specificity phosphatase PhoE